MSRVIEVTRPQLDARRREILDHLGTSYEQLAARAEARSLIGEEWAAWEELHEINFLLGDDNADR